MFWVDFLFQIVIVTIDGQLKFWWLCGSLSNRKNIRSNSSFFVEKLVKDDTRLFPEFGCGKETVLETVLNKIRKQRRQQKEKYLTSKEVLSTDSASESAKSSSWNPIPPTYTYQLQRVQKAYNLYFEEDVGITEVITANKWLPVFFL